MTENKMSQVSEEKKVLIKELSKELSDSKTILIASIKGLPAKQFQQIKKSIRDGARVWVIRKRAILRAIDKSNDEKLKEIKDFIKEDIALITSKEDVFALASKLLKNKSPVKAKAGQEAPEDVEVEAGVTELPAGPAVSELGSVGLTVKVNQGKIEILENKVIVKAGQKISEDAASVMGKLDILPFSVGFIPKIAYDAESKIIFTELKIDPKAYAEEIRNISVKANSLAIHLAYVCNETIGAILRKAGSHENAINKIVDLVKNEKNETTKEEKDDAQKEEPKSEELK
jgi:large subunit ribosomal protein L10